MDMDFEKMDITFDENFYFGDDDAMEIESTIDDTLTDFLESDSDFDFDDFTF